MGEEAQNEDWEGIIREMIAEATETAPTEPGVYKMQDAVRGVHRRLLPER